MNYRHFKYEGWLYALAFIVALGVRLVALGAMPLSDAEAAPALQALRLSQSADPAALDPHPLYILSTSILFMIFGGGANFLARLVPALVGSLFVLTPRLFDDRIKPRPSLLLAFFLALDPGLVAISRQAASPIFAITCIAFTAGFINKKNYNLAAVTAALALLGGPSLWLGLLGIGITAAILEFFKSKKEDQAASTAQPSTLQQAQDNAFDPSAFESSTRSEQNLQPFDKLRAAPSTLRPKTKFQLPLTFILAFLLAGTLFFTAPGGIGAAFNSIPAFIASWRPGSQITQGMLILSLFIYQPFVILLASIALIRGWTGGLYRIVRLSIWFFVALLLVTFLPARQMADLAWTLLPLNTLAALELARHFTVFPEERREVAGVVMLTVFIWVFAWLGMAGINHLQTATPNFNLRAGMLAGSLFLLLVSLLLVSAGWSIRIARIGGVWGLAAGLGVLSLAGTFGSAGLRGADAPEMWWLPRIPMQADLLRETVSQVSEFGKGNDHTATVAILGVDSPALEWALRENPVRVVASLDVTSTPEFVVTSFEMNPELVSAYRGQDFIWRQSPAWGGIDLGTWFRWVTLRQMPRGEQEVIILWARSDLFLDD